MMRRRSGDLAAAAQFCATAAFACASVLASSATRAVAQPPVRDTTRRVTSETPVDDGRAVGVTQSISITGVARSYRVGTTTVHENSAPFSYRLTSPRLALRLSGTPLQLQVPANTLNATTPINARADVLLRVGDTVSVYGRTGSSPTLLDSSALRAVGAAGTSVLDLSSQGLGVPAQIGARAIFSFPVGDIVLGLSGAVEHEPRPTGVGAVYWQGNTARGAIAANALFGDRSLVVTADVSVSSADSLQGRNQFPGGGAFGLTADLSGPLDAAGRYFFVGDLFYAQPFDNTRADQPTRLIPSGAFIGLSTAVLMESRGLTYTPSVTLLRESSHASVTEFSGTQQSKTTLTGSAWSVAGSISVDIPVWRMFSLSPEVGAVGGNVSSTTQLTSGRTITRRGRTISTTSTNGERDALRGFWASVGLRAKF